MTRSADMTHDLRPTHEKVRVGYSRTIDIVGYCTLTVAFPGNLTVKLLDVAYVPVYLAICFVDGRSQARGRLQNRGE